MRQRRLVLVRPARSERWHMLGWLTGDGVLHQGYRRTRVRPDRAPHGRRRLTAELNVSRRSRTAMRAFVCPTVAVDASRRRRNGVMQTMRRNVARRLLEAIYGLHKGPRREGRCRRPIHGVANDLKIAYLAGSLLRRRLHPRKRRRPNQTSCSLVIAGAASAPCSCCSPTSASRRGKRGRIPKGRKNPQGQLRHLQPAGAQVPRA